MLTLDLTNAPRWHDQRCRRYATRRAAMTSVPTH